ncbi:MAG: cobalamin biosynthesis protein CobC [Zetaproteobacteria bacterium CG_4_9_14_3_um_filter_49_83]|nr:MAG: cobalamin biosynthesis protein CobC [Zetaproteobacteria bacterium CG1_02_49_23]PIQ34422.1 MAG: cobalamin biosynthesis protein CobC [Zetaproteobacteria bacterium CG17_big_fil_post_rev_8_21_14_2_50_50_13]PIV30937.1 MAG: cobalamin biosynthesis protein CobC [Zetaproteobacteria bacterium CG02_land_8_20_14_3_00_50_9]PIY56405.1 MAG: cobalamin biosynthesis protein CobC [Zetaproteobacteria bacterium CG_4_10_14_0_8_um_filter_49_80]PJA34045.1 MAG: cobalamin biosynthesis protein CobC [Zetaproteobac
MIVDILRHGELQGGVRYRGTQNDPLTEHGRSQMQAVWANIQHEAELIITSPLSRCADIAQTWATQRNIEYRIEPRIAELNYGAWEGLTHGEIEAAYPGILAAWRTDPTGMTPPNGESMDALQQRIIHFWDDLLTNKPAAHILVVGHSGSLRMLLTHIMGLPVKASRTLNMPYASWSRVQVQQGKSEVIFQGKS